MDAQNPYLVDCPHRHQRHVRRIHSNGTEHFGKQCMFCGAFIQYVKKDSLSPEQILMVGDYEPSIKDAYYERQRQLRSEQFQQARAENLVKLAEYYETDHWKAYRRFRHGLNQWLFGGLCEMCRECPAEHIHHMTYERLFRELPFDTAAVCERCHTTEHPHMKVEE